MAKCDKPRIKNWPDARAVDQIAFVLLDRTDEERHRIFCEAFNQAIARNPHVRDPELLDPRIVDFVAAIYRRIAEMERQRGEA